LFIMPGPAAKSVVSQYTALTGTTQLPPRFALGYHQVRFARTLPANAPAHRLPAREPSRRHPHPPPPRVQCRWNYKDEADVYGVDAKFEEHAFPYDVLWLDIEHTDGMCASRACACTCACACCFDGLCAACKGPPARAPWARACCVQASATLRGTTTCSPSQMRCKTVWLRAGTRWSPSWTPTSSATAATVCTARRRRRACTCATRRVRSTTAGAGRAPARIWTSPTP
ncbi:hypothetical protein EON62_04380, partial [archaeon]